jgi:hypothetical protein
VARQPRPPILIDPVLDEPDLIEELALANAPYWPVYRYFSDAVELSATGAPVADPTAPMRVPPWFRGDWAHEKALIAGLEPILDNPRFVRAARELYGLSDQAIVRQQLVYANLTLPMPSVDFGHTDVPAFRGISRKAFPVWLLSVMGHSELFERWRIRIATAVSWWFGGVGGEFTYWPDGRDAAPRVRSPRRNTALVGENEFMFHRVERVGPEAAGLQLDGLSIDAELVADSGDWCVVQDGRMLARVPFDEVRISVSWKAEVLEDAVEAERVDHHTDDLNIEQVWQILADDLRRRGRPVKLDDEPLNDPPFIRALGETYARTPTIFPEIRRA